MKTKAAFSIKGYAPFLLLFFSLWFTGCSEDFSTLEGENETTLNAKSDLKNNITPLTYINGAHKDGGIWEISLPDNWNEQETKNVMVFAHGYVVPTDPLEIVSNDINGIPIKQIFNEMGWAYATTSYRSNGLVVKDAILDLKDLRLIVDTVLTESHGLYPPDFVFLAGVSEGGLIGTLTIEQYPELFDASIITCCPIGDFYKHLQYIGDFHVLFNYFFKADLLAMGIDMGDQTAVPKETMALWINGSLQQAIIGVLLQNPEKVAQLISTAKVTVERNDELAVGMAILDLLKFNVMATNDAVARLGGSPYNNMTPKRWYWGSTNDLELNRKVERIKTGNWDIARTEVENFYETAGILSRPLISMHTSGDHIAPFWHQLKYRNKVFQNGDIHFHGIVPVKRYGHCTFTLEEVEMALQLMQIKLLRLNQTNPPFDLEASK